MRQRGVGFQSLQTELTRIYSIVIRNVDLYEQRWAHNWYAYILSSSLSVLQNCITFLVYIFPLNLWGYYVLPVTLRHLEGMDPSLEHPPFLKGLRQCGRGLKYDFFRQNTEFVENIKSKIWGSYRREYPYYGKGTNVEYLIMYHEDRGNRILRNTGGSQTPAE
jgi:hypothetical protein